MNQYIKESVGRFLGWKLPADFAPDAGITFKRDANPDSPIEYQYKHEPVGTNLFTADQAEAMLTHVCKPLTDRVAELDDESKHLRAVAETAISFLKDDGEVKMVDRIVELEAQLAAKDWQPIETAPKDHFSRLFRVNGYCVQGFFDVTGMPCVQSDGQPWRKMQGKPTHWMPRPKPPLAGEAA